MLFWKTSLKRISNLKKKTRGRNRENVGERLGTNSHSYVYVFKIGNVAYEELQFSSELNTQHIESGCMIEVKLSQTTNLMSEGKTRVKRSRYGRPQDLTEWIQDIYLACAAISRCTLVFSREAAMKLTAWVKSAPHLAWVVSFQHKEC